MNEWSFLIQHGRIQDGFLHQVEWEWISLSQIKLVWVKSQSGVRGFLSESGRRKQGVWIQHGRIQDGCHHQVESEWMSEGFFCANGGNQSWQVWVRLRGKTKMAESKMVEFKMAAIIKLSQNEWVKVFFVQMVGTNLGKCEWDWEEKLRWLNPRWWNSRWLPSSSWERMNEFESDWISLSQSQSGVRVVLCKWWEPILASVSEFERKN